MNKRDHVMNAILLGIGLGCLIEPSGDAEMMRAIFMITVPVLLGAMVPDIDAVMGRHRKTLHNLPLLAAFAAFPFYFGNLHYVWIGVFTHYFLDVAGSKRGIALFYPLLDREYRLPIGVPVKSRSADLMTLAITALELLIAAVVLYALQTEGIEITAQSLGF